MRFIAGVLVDDGAVFHVNGSPVAHLNIAPGAFLATNQSYETYYQLIELPSHVIVEGENLLAVEVKQGALNSSDIMFGMTLVAVWPDPVEITAGPAMEGGILGNPTTFRIRVVGTEPRVQWLKDGIAIVGATNLTYAISQTQSTDAGRYSVAVTNSVSAHTSNELLLQPAPDIFPPVLLSASAHTSVVDAIDLTFSEPATNARSPSNYTLARDGEPLPITTVQSVGNRVRLRASEPIDSNHFYTITVGKLRDSLGNEMTVTQTMQVPSFRRYSLVPVEASWRFWPKPLDNGLSREWTRLDYDDSNWAGPFSAPFCNSNATYQLPGNPVLPIARTIYFRTTFLAPSNAANFATLSIPELLDDGGVFYLNGVEIARYRMAGGTPSYNTFADIRGNSRFLEFSLWERAAAQGVGLLRPGTNVFAAELHQSASDENNSRFSPNRPDLFFAAGLNAWILNGPRLAPMTYRREGNDLFLTWPDPNAEFEAAESITAPGKPFLRPASSTARR